MAHPLLIPPARRMSTEDRIRLPMIQDIGGANVRGWYATLRKRDDLRLARTSGTQIATGPLPAVQIFAMSGPGQPNTPESMRSGLRMSTARRLVDKNSGRGAGI